MALLQLLTEEDIAEDGADDYVDELYRVVCVGQRPALDDRPSGMVRSTYIVDWEQLVHLLDDYQLFGEDIVELAAITEDGAAVFHQSGLSSQGVARA